MKFYGIVACLVGLAACNTPPLGYAGINAERVSIGKSTFDVRLKDGQAQAIRVNSEFAPNLNYVAPRARAAMEQVSGCKVADGSMVGDSIVISADLECSPISQETAG